MRVWQFAATVIAMAHMMPAAAQALVSIGPRVDGSIEESAARIADRPETVNGQSFAFTLQTDWYNSLSSARRLVEPRLRRPRFISMLDYSPLDGSGFHLSAGVRLLARSAKAGWVPFHASRIDNPIYAPSLAGVMPDRSNLRRMSPMATLGWRHALSAKAALGFETGVMMEQGIARPTLAGIAQPRLATSAWSRVDPVTQLSFRWRF